MRNKNLLLIVSVFLFALIIRIIFPNLYFVTGDAQSHILASLRLHLTNPFSSDPLYNTFSQILQYEHGYTTMVVPYILYEFFFGFLKFTLNESNILYITVLFGMFNLFCIFYFLRLIFGEEKAIYSILFISILPIQIGLSREFAGWQIIQSSLFFLSLSFLYQFIETNKNKYKIYYFITTFFYIGGDNSFFIGIFFQLIFIYLISKDNKILNYKRIYQNRYTVIFIILPILAYIIFSFISLQYGIERGYLLRLITKVDSDVNFGLTKIFYRCIWLYGLPFFIFLLSLLKFKEIKEDKKLIYLLFLFVFYFILLSLKVKLMEDNYVYFLMVPIIVIPIALFFDSKYFKWIYFLAFILTFLYSMSIVYGMNIGFDTPTNFGSINKGPIKDNNYGQKTLGYLIRSNELEVSYESYPKFGYDFLKLGIYTDIESISYYLGGINVRELDNLRQLDKYVVVHINYNEPLWTGQNADVEKFVKGNNLTLWGYIVDDKTILMEIYTNEPKSIIPKEYDKKEYDKIFDKKYGNLDEMSKIELGFY